MIHGWMDFEGCATEMKSGLWLLVRIWRSKRPDARSVRLSRAGLVRFVRYTGTNNAALLGALAIVRRYYPLGEGISIFLPIFIRVVL